MKLLVMLALLALPGCATMPDINSIVKQQSENCDTNISGSLGGGMLGTQTGVISFTMNCKATGVPATAATTAVPAVKP